MNNSVRKIGEQTPLDIRSFVALEPKSKWFCIGNEFPDKVENEVAQYSYYFPLILNSNGDYSHCY